MIVPCQGDLEIRLHRPDHIESGLHRIERPLIHRYHCLVEPAPVPEVTGEISNELAPVDPVRRTSRCSLDILHPAGSPVYIVESQGPRDHRIAVYLSVNPYLFHKFHPSVKYGIVIAPAAIGIARLGDHRTERIIGLSVPRPVNDSRGDRLLPGIREDLHYRSHQIEMLLAPQFHIMVPGHRIRILPQVKVELPV